MKTRPKQPLSSLLLDIELTNLIGITVGAATLSTTTLSLMAISITLNISRHSAKWQSLQSVVMLSVIYVECRYAECRYAECRGTLLAAKKFRPRCLLLKK